jgi:hypothetical protein
MKETKISDKVKAYRVPLNMLVTASTFATCLAEHYYSSGESFNNNLKRTEARYILTRRLFFHGVLGEYDNSFWESGNERVDYYNSLFEFSLKWIIKNYPYLVLDNEN